MLFDLIDLSGFDILGLTLTAFFGFLIGKLRRNPSTEGSTAERDMQRAKAIIEEFEVIAAKLQQAAQSQHQQQVVQFKDRVNTASQGRRNADWDDFSIEAERIPKLTLALADQALYQAKESGHNQIHANDSEGGRRVESPKSEESCDADQDPSDIELAVS